MKEYLILVEFHNAAPYVEKIVSHVDLTFEDITAFYERKENTIDWERDGITLLDDISEYECVPVAAK